MLAKPDDGKIRDTVAEAQDRLRSEVTQAALRYWLSTRGERIWPRREDFDPAEVKHLLPNLAVLSVERNPVDFVYRLTGTDVDAHMGGNLKGRQVGEIPNQRAPSAYWTTLLATAETGLPQAREIAYANARGDFRSCEVIGLPYSTHGQSIDRVIVAFEFRRLDDS
ncbi:PAS domain-containing protein [Minwuia thermotolerans]|uniref:PAS domain-containing protein n=1 Tax=Minwuia thermotolerans TaxID=2056226 RepID=A0A2M9FZR5_9PROT|nr:PAS domain-containing protein [Minwuia thermotolerans]PJK28950.1 hypothetical protein CVT23_13575 [Minwuia thermotolerans]